jgi:hypothetical protein
MTIALHDDQQSWPAEVDVLRIQGGDVCGGGRRSPNHASPFYRQASEACTFGTPATNSAKRKSCYWRASARRSSKSGHAKPEGARQR